MPTEKLPHGADPRGKLYPEPRERWRDENREALASINVFVDEHGCWRPDCDIDRQAKPLPAN